MKKRREPCEDDHLDSLGCLLGTITIFLIIFLASHGDQVARAILRAIGAS
jgi:hypothetical protein